MYGALTLERMLTFIEKVLQTTTTLWNTRFKGEDYTPLVGMYNAVQDS